MNARERFLCTLDFEKPDRLPFYEYMGFWPETIDRFISEGMPKDANIEEYFGFDKKGMVRVDFNFIPPFTREVYEEDDETRTVRDETGCVKKEFKYGSAMPHYIKFPIKTREDFLGIKERLDPTSPARYSHNWQEIVANMQSRDFPVGLVCRGLLAFGRDFMDFTDLMIAFATEPEWMREMISFHTEFLMVMWERALTDIDIDFVLLGEDMAYKTGPMVSPAMVREFMLPHYIELADYFRAHGVKHFIIDSDGDIRELLPIFKEAGVTAVLPMENNAGCDPVKVRVDHTETAMIGGIDKQKIAIGGTTLEEELKYKIEGMSNTGGYIPSFDHSVHPDVSLETYKKYLDVRRELEGH